MSQVSPRGRAEGTTREELIHNLPLSLVDWPVHSWGRTHPALLIVSPKPPLDSYWEVVPLHVFILARMPDVCLSLPVRATGRASRFVWVVAAAGTWLGDSVKPSQGHSSQKASGQICGDMQTESDVGSMAWLAGNSGQGTNGEEARKVDMPYGRH